MSDPYHPDAYTVHGYPIVGDNPTQHPDRMETIRAEAAAMGLEPTADPVTFSAFGWTFRRRWVYWTAGGPAIPLNVAGDLWLSHGGALRVDGHCGSPRPLANVGHYHIDTPAAMQALLDALRGLRVTLVSLADLRDPSAFLSGARLPLAHRWPLPFTVVEWCASRLLIGWSDGSIRVDSLRLETVRMLALDLADPHVARWVDGKIASIIYPDVIAATIVARGSREGFGIACLRASEAGVGTFTGALVPPLAGIPCDEANIPTARAALLRALFGVKS